MEDLLGVKLAVRMQRVEQNAPEQAIRHLYGDGFGQPGKELEQSSLAGEFHELEHHALAGILLLIGRIIAAEIEQCVAEFRQVGQKFRGKVVGKIEQIVEFDGDIPGGRSLVENDGKHRRQRHAVGLVMPAKDFGEVAEQAKQHRGIRLGLVLEKQIKQHLAAREVDREKQIRVNLLEVGFDERRRNERERIPIDPCRNGRRQVLLEKRNGMLRLGEHGLEERVVRVRGKIQIRGEAFVHGQGISCRFMNGKNRHPFPTFPATRRAGVGVFRRAWRRGRGIGGR